MASELERIRKYFAESTDCWHWTGYLDKDGYGQFWVTTGVGKGTNKRAHRAVYELLVGPIPEGMVLDHLCEVRDCVNPNHLEPTSVRGNTLRSGKAPAAVNARKTHCSKGHRFTPDNTYRPPKAPNQRHCKECKAIRHRKAVYGI